MTTGSDWQDYEMRMGSGLDSEEREIDLREYLTVLLKYRWGILGIALLAGLIGLYSAFRAVPIYKSTAVLQIQPPVRNIQAEDPYNYIARTSRFYSTQHELISSWAVAERVAEKLGLLDADHLEGQVAAPEQDMEFNWRKLIPGFLSVPRRPVSVSERRANIIAGVKGTVQVEPVIETQLIHMSVEDPDPVYAARKANLFAESYIEFTKDTHLENITSSQSWFSSRLDQASRDLEMAESALQEFRERWGLLEIGGDMLSAKNQRLQVALTGREDARKKRLGLESVYRQVNSVRTIGGDLSDISQLESYELVKTLKDQYVAADRRVTELSQRYGPKHPRMIEARRQLTAAKQLYRDELEVAADKVTTEYASAQQEEVQFDRELEQAETDVRSLNRQQAELTKLQNDVESSRRLYAQLQSGEKTGLMLESGTQQVIAMIIEHARPGVYPVRPNKQKMLLLWTTIGVALGIGLAFMLNYLDNTFKDSDDVENKLGIPVLGTLLNLKKLKSDELAPMSQFLENSRSAFSEAIRTIRTGVLLSRLDSDKTVIVITSSVPAEGKTTLAINLAHSIAQMKKTILVDADMRRPMIRKAKGIDKAKPGFSALITGEAELDEVVDTQEIDPLHIIHAGVAPPNPLELLSSQRFNDILEHLKSIYEVVVIDSAPALAVSDALVVSQLSDLVLYVVRADATPHQAALQGLKRLRRAGAPVLGVILNRVMGSKGGYYGKYNKFGRNYRYYRYGRYGSYGDYYHEYYGDDQTGDVEDKG